MIAGAVLDVFEKEPLSEKSELWDFDNVYISPHFACCDKDVYKRTISNFGDNLEAYAKGGKENLLTMKYQSIKHNELFHSKELARFILI